MSSSLDSTKLPSKKEVMALFFYYKEVMKQEVRDSSNSTIMMFLMYGQKLGSQQD